MPNRNAEHTIFEAFLAEKPDFVGETIREWHQPDEDPPDIFCITNSDKRIGVELKEWLNEDHMRNAKGKERIEDSIRKVIGQQRPNECEHIWFLWLHPKPRIRIAPGDQEKFRTEIYGLIREIDQSWSHTEMGQPNYLQRDFSSYLTVGNYLEAVSFFPRRRYVGWPPNGEWVTKTSSPGIDWILFEPRGGAYSQDYMLIALFELLAETVHKYDPNLCSNAGLDEFNLVVHYNQAYIYNSPAETLNFKFADAAEHGSNFLNNDAGPFQRVFLFVAIENEERVFSMYGPNSPGSVPTINSESEV